MIAGSIERTSLDCSEPTVWLSFSSSIKSEPSSSKSGLNLATAAKTMNATKDKKQSAPYPSKSTANI
jgi:hypothetical protein